MNGKMTPGVGLVMVMPPAPLPPVELRPSSPRFRSACRTGGSKIWDFLQRGRAFGTHTLCGAVGPHPAHPEGVGIQVLLTSHPHKLGWPPAIQAFKQALHSSPSHVSILENGGVRIGVRTGHAARNPSQAPVNSSLWRMRHVSVAFCMPNHAEGDRGLLEGPGEVPCEPLPRLPPCRRGQGSRGKGCSICAENPFTSIS